MSIFTQFGVRPRLTLVIENQFVTEIWVDGRTPIISIHDYDWGQTDLEPACDPEGLPFTRFSWKRPAWALGLSLHPPETKTDLRALSKSRRAIVPIQY